MRSPSIRQLVVKLSILGLLLPLAGCRSGFSAPSMDWLSWGKKPTSTTALSAAPRKPSSTMLPSPAATTASTRSPGAAGGLATAPSYPSAGYANPAAGPSGFASSPYGMAQSGPAAGGGYSGGAVSYGNPNMGSVPPYSSPAGEYRTADGRSNAYPQYQSPANAMASPASPPYSTPGTLGGSAYPRASGAYGPVEPAAYGATPPGGYPPAGSAPRNPVPAGISYGVDPRTVGAGSLPPNTTGGTSNGTLGLSTQSGGYRPGSTSRNPSLLGTQPSMPTAPSSTPAGAYPTGNYPTGSPVNQQLPTSPASSYGGYSYPNTGQ